MRVAVVAEEAGHGDEPQGTARLRRIAELLADRGHAACVFCARWWEGDVPAFESGGVDYRAVAPGVGAPDRRFLARLPAAIRAFGPDVIHAAHSNAVAVHGAVLAGTLTRTPVVVDWYDTRTREGWMERLRRPAARLPEAVVAPSRLVRTGIRELGRESVAVVPGAVDMELVRSVEPDPAGDLVYARRLDGAANVESMLLALAELRELGWEAAVIGDGPERPRYERQAADLRIDDRVRFLGEQPVERRLAAFKGAHVAVHTATVAPFAADFLRALACGCVGVVEYHAASSAHELVEGRDRGFRVTSEEELADAIRGAADFERLDVDESFAEYDEPAVLERYLDLYREA